MRIHRMIKSLLIRAFPQGNRPRRVVSGIFRGIILQLELTWGLQMWLGLYEREVQPVMNTMLRRAGSCVDIGAGYGEIPCLCLTRHPSLPVVAIEPNTDSLHYLRRNLELNAFANPRLKILPLFAGEGPPATHRSLTEIVADLPTPVFIKLDVDGPEAEILQAAHGWLAARQALLLIETHSFEAEEKITRQLAGLGYSVRLVRPAWWRNLIPEKRPLPHNRWLVAESAP
jgi:precorrin-6B methylase 2